MNGLKQDMARIQELIGTAFAQTGCLVALSDGGMMSPEKLQQTLEQTMEHFERSALELRRLCEQYSPGVGGYGNRARAPAMEIAGHVEILCEDWLHICLNTLLPHCRFQSPNWLTDTIRRLLDHYEAQGKPLPRYKRALLVIDEHSSIGGRHVFDQDNKGLEGCQQRAQGAGDRGRRPVHPERGPRVQNEQGDRLPHYAAGAAGRSRFLFPALRRPRVWMPLRRPLTPSGER